MIKDLKITKTYSMDPMVAAWVRQKAALLTIQNEGGARSSDSKVVNDILRSVMEKEMRTESVDGLKKIAEKVKGKK